MGQRISAQLPPGARLVWATATRFVVALAGEPLLEALMSIDRVRDALEREQWCVGDECVSLAFGAGVATRRGRDEPIAETLAAAERSLAHSRRLAVKRHAEGEAGDASADSRRHERAVGDVGLVVGAVAILVDPVVGDVDLVRVQPVEVVAVERVAVSVAIEIVVGRIGVAVVVLPWS